MSITTLMCVGGPYDGQTIDVNDRVMMGDVPIHIVGRASADSTRPRKMGEYRLGAVGGRHVLTWVEAREEHPTERPAIDGSG